MSSPVEQETRSAVRLLLVIVVAAVGIWLALGLVITDEATLTAYGRSERNHDLIARGGRRMYYAQHAAMTFDRQATYGDRPMVWILGSSITREAFDEGALEAALQAAGVDVGVRKYAFDRGAPVFSWAMLDSLELRPGDRVITTVSYDNFRTDWLRYYGGFHVYLTYLLSPSKVLRVRSLPMAQRLDYALTGAPPGRLQRVLPQFRDGLEAWLRYRLGREDKPPKIEPPRTFSKRDVIMDFREQSRFELNRMTRQELQLAPGQVNYDALGWWREEVLAAGAEPWVLFLPPGPEYAPRFLVEDFREAFHARMEEQFPPYVQLAQLPQDHFTDYKHVNNDGRPLITHQLAQLLIDTPIGEPPGPPDPVIPTRPSQMHTYPTLRARLTAPAPKEKRRKARHQPARKTPARH